MAREGGRVEPLRQCPNGGSVKGCSPAVYSVAHSLGSCLKVATTASTRVNTVPRTKCGILASRIRGCVWTNHGTTAVIPHVRSESRDLLDPDRLRLRDDRD